MLYIPRLLLIGSTGRNSGKTELSTRLVRRFSKEHRIVGLKVTTIEEGKGPCPRGGEGCGVCEDHPGGWILTEEKNLDKKKDTSRLLSAGAERVFWLKTEESCLELGFKHFLEQVPSDIAIIGESNRLRTVLWPGMFFLVHPRSRGKESIKASAARVAEYADRLVENDGTHFSPDLSSLFLNSSGWKYPEDMGAVVLAGGESRRMGRDKSLLPWRGKTLIEGVLEQLKGNVGDMVVSTNRREAYSFLNMKIAEDDEKGLGPISGILSGVRASSQEINAVVAGDIPFINLPLLRKMKEKAYEGFKAVIPLCQGYYEPLFGIYTKGILSTLEQALNGGTRKILDALPEGDVYWYQVEDMSWLRNINTEEEYRALTEEDWFA